MEEAFNKLKAVGKTDVESLVKWMKDSKVIEEAKAAEDKVRKLLSETANKQAVEFSKFKEVVGKMAEEQKKSVDDFSKQLVEQGPKVMEAVKAGVSAFKEALTKK